MNKRECSGFTLVELLIAIMVSGFLLAGATALIASANRTYSGEDVKTGVRQDARAAFDLIITELTMAGFNPKQSPNFTGFEVIGPVAVNPTMEASRIRFFMDLPFNSADLTTADGLITVGSSEDITYSLNGSDLQRNGQTVIPNVTSLSFIYRDGNGAVTGAAANVRQIDLSIAVQSSAPDLRTGQKKSITLTGIVFPRNLLYAGS